MPFCRHRCDYCAFATWTDRLPLAERYLAACRRQVLDASADGSLGPVSSAFVGGGTPSLAPVRPLLAVLDAAPLAPGAEVTVEANPDDVTEPLLAAYLDGGATRLSIGVQSLVPSVLRALGRTHDPDSVRRAADAAHHLGLAFNVDLIYGAAGETIDQWAQTLAAAVALEPAHVSAYALTVEPGTPLASQPDRHPDDDDQADKYLLATEVLAAAGFEWYEISNWALLGQRCQHNLLYWQHGDYLGVGCAAHSHRAGRRWWNLRTPERYVDAVERGRSVEAGQEMLDADRRRFERHELALRTDRGVPADAFEPGALDGLAPLVTVDSDHVTLTLQGRLLANEVAVHLR